MVIPRKTSSETMRAAGGIPVIAGEMEEGCEMISAVAIRGYSAGGIVQQAAKCRNAEKGYAGFARESRFGLKEEDLQNF
jgi:hypothetical protein